MTQADRPRVLDVGQCDFDHHAISRMLSGEFGAVVDRANAADEALGAVKTASYDLVLVNRILDADGSEGLELIRRLLGDDASRTISVMLVSNHKDAQDAAVTLGAQRGFGKDDLGSSATVELLASHLGG